MREEALLKLEEGRIKWSKPFSKLRIGNGMMVLKIIKTFISVAIVMKKQILKMCFCKPNRIT